MAFLFATSPEPDALLQVLASMDEGEWSSNIRGAGIRATVLHPSDPGFAAFFGHDGDFTGTVSGDNQEAFSGGVYIPSLRKYWRTGGGHGDWLGNETHFLDMRTLNFTICSQPCTLDPSEEDPGAPFQTTGAAYRVWPNFNNERGPASTHTYGMVEYLDGLDKIYVHGYAAFDLTGNPGGSWLADTATGKWSQDLPDDAWSGAPYVAGDSQAHWFSDIQRLFIVGSGVGAIVGYLLDPVGKTSHSEVHRLSAQPNLDNIGAVIDDPLNVGYRALALPAADSPTTQFCILPAIDSSPFLGSGDGTMYYEDYGNTRPAEISSTRQTWVNMAQFFPGSTKIAVWTNTVGIYILDMADWTWSAQIVAPPAGLSTGSGTAPYKKFFYMPAPYNCFGLINGADCNFYVYKPEAGAFD